MSIISTVVLSKESSGETHSLDPHLIAPNTTFSVYAKVEEKQIRAIVSQKFSLNCL